MFILKELRTEHGLKRSELARETGINANTLANYEKGTRQASYETLISTLPSTNCWAEKKNPIFPARSAAIRRG